MGCVTLYVAFGEEVEYISSWPAETENLFKTFSTVSKEELIYFEQKIITCSVS